MPSLQEAVQFSQQVRSLAGTIEMLELQVDQLPQTFVATKVKINAAVSDLNAIIAESVALADKMKADARTPATAAAPPALNAA